jgi:type IV pilus assembly protein PilX
MEANTMNPQFNSNFRGQPSDQGMSLIVVLIMLIVIGITAASSMRSATSEQRATNNLRLESTAQQYAEAALRYCETELQRATAARPATLRTNVIPTTTFAVSGWEHTLTWTASNGRASATRTTVPDAQIGNSDTELPATRPQCVVETQARPVGTTTFDITVVTARGFSPDYAADGNGKTIRGSVVWLQSIINGVF